MQTLENLNDYFNIFEKIIFEEKGFARVGKDYGIGVAAVHARYEFIRMAVCRSLLLLSTEESRPLIGKLFQEEDPGRDILTVLRKSKDELLPYYRTIRAKMRYEQMQLDQEQMRLDHEANLVSLESTCHALAGDVNVIKMLKSLF